MLICAGEQFQKMASCDAAFERGGRTSGVYTLNVRGIDLQVYCEIQSQGNNWVVRIIQSQIKLHRRLICRQTNSIFQVILR